MTAVRYVKKILRLNVIPMRRQMGHNFILMHGNTLPHITRVVLNFLKENNIELVTTSTDVPEFESHVWSTMGKRLRDLERPPINLQELEAALHKIWCEIPQTTIRACIDMSARL